MNNKGLTLIELMLVLAIMGIIFPLTNYKDVLNRYDYQQNMIKEQDKVLRFHKKLNNLLKNSNSFNSVNSKKIEADNFYIRVSNNKKRIDLNGEIFEFRSFEFGNFKKENDVFVVCDIKNTNLTFKYYLTPNKKKDEQKYENSSESNEQITPKEEINIDKKDVNLPKILEKEVNNEQ